LSGEFEGESLFRPFDEVSFESKGAFDVDGVSEKGFDGNGVHVDFIFN